MIILNNITQALGVASPFTMTGRVSSADEVIVICAGADDSVQTTVSFNGTPIPATVQQANGALTANGIYINWHPPVGNYSVTFTNGTAANINVTVMSLLGVSKRTTTPLTAATTATSAAPRLTLQVPSPNSIIIDCYYNSGEGAVLTPLAPQVQVRNAPDGDTNNFLVSYKFTANGLQTMGWTDPNSDEFGYVAVALEPDDAPSMWYPTITTRSQNDVANALKDHVTTLPVSNGYFATDFYQNSFLHTIGRIIAPPASNFTLVAETELQTSQILVDRITQQAAASSSSITSDHLVTSQDTVLVIFASGMGVAQGISNVFLNGVPITSQIQNTVSTVVGGLYFINNPNVGVNTVNLQVTLPTALELVVLGLLGVDKKTINPVISTNSGLTGSPSLAITPSAANSLIIDYVGSLGTSISENPSQTVYFDQPQTASQAAGSIKLSTNSPQVMSWTTLSSAWVQLAIALEPAQAPSIWFPTIDARNISDVITVNALDDSTNPLGNFYQTYGNHPTQLWQNSFLHTIGRLTQRTAAPVNASISQVGATLTFTGGTQAVTSVDDVSIAQSAATLTFSGGTQAVATVNDVSIAQTHATLTLTGGTQTVASVSNSSITQVGATLTFTGGTQTVAIENNVSVSQSAATLTFTGGTQVISTVNDVAISQSAATLTFTGGTQTVSATVIASSTITQVVATLTFTGGTQAIASVQKVSISQSTATLTLTGGIQSIATINDVAISQSGATLTFTGGTQSLQTIRDVQVSQIAAVLTFTGGTQSIISTQLGTVTQVAATLTFSGGVQTVSAAAIIPPDFIPLVVTLNAQTYNLTLNAAVDTLVLDERDSLNVTLQAQPLSTALSSVSRLTLSAETVAITLDSPEALSVILAAASNEVTLVAKTDRFVVSEDSLNFTLSAANYSIDLDGASNELTLSASKTNITLQG